MSSETHRKLNICVITPHLQGDYMGEILNHIRYLCESRNLRFNAIRTNSFGEFDLGLGLSDYDGIIVIRNAASPRLIETIQSRKIPIIAVAHDYFPLSVPIVSCDNGRGMELAFNYLFNKGHTRMVFIGDVAQYDLRKRYEHFCELHAKNKLICLEEQLIPVSESLFSDGLAGGGEFLKLSRDYTGVICGAGYTAMGFIRRMEEAAIKVPEDIEVVGFDNIPLMHVLTPQLPIIDQNLNILARKSLEILESIILYSSKPEPSVSIAPTLKEPYFCGGQQAFINAHPFEARGIANPDYANSLLHGTYELTQNIVNSNLEQLMSIAPLFEQFMEVACLTKLVNDKFNRTRLRHVKIFTHSETINIDESDDNYIFPLESFPGRFFNEKYGRQKDSCIHFPITCQEETWGFLSVFGSSSNTSKCSSFTGFTTYMDTIVNGFSHQLYIDSIKSGMNNNATAAIRHEEDIDKAPGFSWDLDKGKIRWNKSALALLGFTTDLEQNIYRNMEIFDRVHDDDEQALRKQLTLSLSNLDKMKMEVRLKNAEGEYIAYLLQGETSREKDKKAIQYRCRISLV